MTTWKQHAVCGVLLSGCAVSGCGNPISHNNVDSNDYDLWDDLIGEQYLFGTYRAEFNVWRALLEKYLNEKRTRHNHFLKNMNKIARLLGGNLSKVV